MGRMKPLQSAPGIYEAVFVRTEMGEASNGWPILWVLWRLGATGVGSNALRQIRDRFWALLDALGLDRGLMPTNNTTDIDTLKKRLKGSKAHVRVSKQGQPGFEDYPQVEYPLPTPGA